jgi:hypothetical protein
LTRPANHRQSILNLPGVTQADIAAVYDKWTEIRATAAVRRAPGPDPEAVANDVREAAMRG